MVLPFPRHGERGRGAGGIGDDRSLRGAGRGRGDDLIMDGRLLGLTGAGGQQQHSDAPQRMSGDSCHKLAELILPGAQYAEYLGRAVEPPARMPFGRGHDPRIIAA